MVITGIARSVHMKLQAQRFRKFSVIDLKELQLKRGKCLYMGTPNGPLNTFFRLTRIIYMRTKYDALSKDITSIFVHCLFFNEKDVNDF